MNNGLLRAGFVFGLMQCMTSFGCGNTSASTEQGFNQALTPKTAASIPAVVANSPVNSPVTMPVRIPRPLLEKNLIGNISTHSTLPELSLKLESPVVWEEEPTHLAAPKAGAQADYRDFRGCLHYQDLNGVAVCFNVMPDVSSVGVNSNEMTVHGIENFMTEQLTTSGEVAACAYEVQNVKLAHAVRKGNQITMDFTSDLVPRAECESGKQSLMIQVQLQAANE